MTGQLVGTLQVMQKILKVPKTLTWQYYMKDALQMIFNL